MSDEWYRAGDWSEQTAALFEARLARARPESRPQYLRIQGLTLSESGHLDVARELLERVLRDYGDDLEAAGACEVLGLMALQRGDLEQAQHWFRHLLTRWPDQNGTTGTGEVLLADVLTRSEGAGQDEEALALLEQFLDRESGIRWSSVMFQWHLIRLRVAERQGDADTAAAHAADALELAAAGPQIPNHRDVGLVHADQVTLVRLRRIAGPFPVGTGAPYGRATPEQIQEREVERPVLDEMAYHGWDVPEVWALDPSAPGYHRVIPVLIRHLHDERYPDSVREGLARALGTPLAVPYWQMLTDYLLTLDPKSQVRSGLAAALSQAATKEQLPNVTAILHDPTWDEDRTYFLSTLTRLRAPNRWSLIESLADDPQIGPQARHMLASRQRRAT
jgi:tetratricopeptide (TPR) repeat protein